jgi:KUP system potassium uptake protein
MKLSYFPQIKVVHTSKIFHGQLYVPMLNWLMMIGTVLIAGIYNNTTSLGNAYGVCVMFVTFFDTCMVSLAALMVWRIKPYYIILPWITIAAIDGTFLSSALTKVPQGAWFTIALAIILASLFILWRYGKENQWRAEAEDRYPSTHFVRRTDDGGSALTEKYGGTDLTTIKGFGVFFDKAGETTPIVFSQFVTKLAAMPEVMVFFHLRPLEQPTVPVEDRFTVSKLAIPNCYRLVVRHGYMDEIITPDLAALIVEKVRSFIIIRRTTKKDKMSPDAHAELDAAQQAGSSSREKQAMPEADDDSDNVSINLARLESSFAHQVLYVIGKEQMKINKTKGLWRRFLLSIFLFVRENTRTKMASLKVPTDKVVEVGFVKDL